MGLTTNEHIKAVIDLMDCSIKVNSVSSLGSGRYKLFTTNTKWATFGKLLNGKQIVEVVQDEFITVKSTTSLVAGIYTLQSPFFYYGTFLDTNAELIKKKQSNDKLPFIYLHLNAPELFKDEFDMVDFESDCAIYFMVDCDPKNWLTGGHYTNAIKPMKAMVKEFIRSLSNYAKSNAAYNLTYTQNDYVNFGVVSSDKGVIKQIFTDNISGIELLIKIAWNKCVVCCN
jgi:hypothetical protein